MKLEHYSWHFTRMFERYVKSLEKFRVKFCSWDLMTKVWQGIFRKLWLCKWNDDDEDKYDKRKCIYDEIGGVR